MSSIRFFTRALSAFVLIGSVGATSMTGQASAVSRMQSGAQTSSELALAGPRPAQGQKVDPCAFVGACVAHSA